MASPQCTPAPLPYPELIIDPKIHLAAYIDLVDPAVPETGHWDLRYSTEQAIGPISIRERGGAVFRHKSTGLFKVCVFQRSSWFFNIYPWNLIFTIKKQDGQFIIQHIQLCKKVKGARGELCRRDYLYWNLCSHLLGRAFDRSLLSLNQALRIQCTHIVELIRYAVADFLRAAESGALDHPPRIPTIERGNSPDDISVQDLAQMELLYSESEITNIFRQKQDDTFFLLGAQQEYFADPPKGDLAEGALHYQLAIPEMQQALGQTLSGSVKIKPFTCGLAGKVGAQEFQAFQGVANMAGLDAFVHKTLGVNPFRVLASTLSDVVAYLSLGQLFSYPFTQSENRHLYEKVVKKNSFCIGWRPNLIDPEVLASIVGANPLPETPCSLDDGNSTETATIAAES